jgi:hypothetical protein
MQSSLACGKLAFMTPKKGQLVVAQGRTGTFKVLKVAGDGMNADIQLFNVSKQKLVNGEGIITVPSSTLFPFIEDSSQAALRVVRESTEGK